MPIDADNDLKVIVSNRRCNGTPFYEHTVEFGVGTSSHIAFI